MTTLTDKPTKEFRREHVTRIKAIARAIADKVEAGNELSEVEQGFLSLVVGERGTGSDDHAGELRTWADDYSPKRGRGQAPMYSHVDAALAYVAERSNGRTHYKAILVLSAIYAARENALERAIWPLIPNACAYLGVPVDVALWRDTPPPKSK